jgi:hypothetical protein
MSVHECAQRATFQIPALTTIDDSFTGIKARQFVSEMNYHLTQGIINFLGI